MSKSNVKTTGEHSLRNWIFSILIAGGAATAIINFALPRIWPDNKPPTAKIDINSVKGPVPLKIICDAAKSSDPEGKPLQYEWFLDGTSVSMKSSFERTLEKPDTYNIKLVVRDHKGLQETDSIFVEAIAEKPRPTPPIGPKTKREIVHMEGEEYSASSAHVGIDQCSEGGRLLGWINDGEWVVYRNVYFGEGGYSTFEARVSSAETGGTITVRLDSHNGEVITSCGVFSTGGWNNWRTISCNLTKDLSGSQDIYLVFNGGGTFLFNINWFEFK